MHFRAFVATCLAAFALLACTAYSAPVPRLTSTAVEAAGYSSPFGALIVARGRLRTSAPAKPAKGSNAAPPASAVPAPPPPGSGLRLVAPTAEQNQQSNDKKVQAFLNPQNPQVGAHLDKALDEARTGRVKSALHTVDDRGAMPKGNASQKTGLRLDGQGGCPEGQTANIQIQANGPNAGKSTYATCIVHDGANPTREDVKDALSESSKTGMIAHLYRRLLELFR